MIVKGNQKGIGVPLFHEENKLTKVLTLVYTRKLAFYFFPFQIYDNFARLMEKYNTILYLAWSEHLAKKLVYKFATKIRIE